MRQALLAMAIGCAGCGAAASHVRTRGEDGNR
jgi:hypothetical protein